jgi:hypothetical protein
MSLRAIEHYSSKGSAEPKPTRVHAGVFATKVAKYALAGRGSNNPKE